MLGAIIGDIIGSRFEWNNIKTKEFDLFTDVCGLAYDLSMTLAEFDVFDRACKFTDDSVMTLAVAKALLDCGGDYARLGESCVKSMREIGRLYPNSGYGGMFRRWMFSDDPEPYNSFGNGAAMRVSPCGFVAKSIDEAISLSRKVTEVTHNHPEGIKGAEAAAVCVFLAKAGKSIPNIRDHVNMHYYPMDFTLDQIRADYEFNETCQETVPQAITAFLESVSFEDAVRNAISIGGDSDTIAAIAGGIAEPYYGVPGELRERALAFLDDRLLRILADFENAFPNIKT